MKKILSILLVLMMLFSVTAFAESGPGGTPPGDPPSGEMGTPPDGAPGNGGGFGGETLEESVLGTWFCCTHHFFLKLCPFCVDVGHAYFLVKFFGFHCSVVLKMERILESE